MPTILIIDDSADHGDEPGADSVQTANYEIATANNGKEGLESLPAGSNPPLF